MKYDEIWPEPPSKHLNNPGTTGNTHNIVAVTFEQACIVLHYKNVVL